MSRKLPSGITAYEARGQKRYRVVVDVTPPGTAKYQGQRKQVKRSFATLAEAREWQDRTRGQVSEGRFVPDGEITVDQVLDGWLAGKGRKVRPVTLRGYEDSAKHWRRTIGKRRAGHVTKADVEQVVNDMIAAGLSARTIRGAVMVLRSAYETAVADQSVPRNPTATVEIPAYRPPAKRAWNPKEAATFLATASEDRLSGAWWLTMAGLRRSEVLGLTWADIDFDERTITIRRGRVLVTAKQTDVNGPKSRRSGRVLPMDDWPDLEMHLRSMRKVRLEEAMALGRRVQPGDFIVVDQAAEPLRPERYSDLFTEMCETAKVPALTLHEARHTAATMMAEAEVPVDVAAAWLGHDPAMYLRTYVHPRAERLRSAGAALGRIYGQL